MRTKVTWFVLSLGLLLFTAAVKPAVANLLQNGGFETPADGVAPPTKVLVASCLVGSSSAAKVWTTWANDCTTTDFYTQLLPSTLPGGGKYMMHVHTNGGQTLGQRGNGIVQDFTPNPAKTESAVWVFVNSGCVGFGTGNGGETLQTDEMTCVTGQWIHFRVPNGVSPATEVIVYAIGDLTQRQDGVGGADFYVDRAVVDEP